MQLSSGSFDGSEPSRKGIIGSESPATEVAFKEFISLYEARMKIDPPSALRFAEEVIALMHNTRWKAYFELAESTKKNNDFALVSSPPKIVCESLVLRRVRCFATVPLCNLSRESPG